MSNKLGWMMREGVIWMEQSSDNMIENQIVLLFIEDSSFDARLLQELLKEKAETTFSLIHRDRLATGLAYLRDNRVDVILVDLGLPDSQGLDTFHSLYEIQKLDERANILLVDDRPENLFSMEEALKPMGQNFIKAGSGVEALRCVLETDFAVIVLDVQMPGMDGFETAASSRSGPLPHGVQSEG